MTSYDWWKTASPYDHEAHSACIEAPALEDPGLRPAELLALHRYDKALRWQHRWEAARMALANLQPHGDPTGELARRRAVATRRKAVAEERARALRRDSGWRALWYAEVEDDRKAWGHRLANEAVRRALRGIESKEAVPC